MSTRSTISKVVEGGRIESIYCHFDGYPSHNGRILLENYDTMEKVDKLLSLGDLSILGIRTEIPQGLTHTFDKPLDDVCVAYGRDRGETDVDTKIYDRFDYRKNLEEYNYIFEDGQWYYFKDTNYGVKGGHENKRPLTKEVCKN